MNRDFISIRNEFRAALRHAMDEHGSMSQLRLLVAPELEQAIVDKYPRAANLKNRPEDGRTVFQNVPVCSRPFVPHSRACLVELVQADPDHLDKLALENEDMGEVYDEDLADWVDTKLEEM